MAQDSRLSRRQLLAGSVAAGSAALAGGAPLAEAHVIHGEVPWQEGEANVPVPAAPGDAYQFFTADEAAFVEAFVARIIPKDDLGPGALEAGAAIFIDRQLAGAFGAAERWYMQGPWEKGSDSQGYQSRYTPAALYRAAIKDIDEYCRKTHGGNVFARLTPAQQDEVIGGLEKGTVKLDHAEAKTFFTVAQQNTVEGFFSDPIYGGNRDMVGWKLIGFPGARYDYRPWVGQHNKPFPLPPVGLHGRPGWTPKS
ncbi:MAG TPA: gluconate 2-dehydrogenase subunit 3 family protein [Hyphomicrobiales bacterium]|nr:gluconate 2-dehydrogenase subunit 3 family protein [Hyphomicrobiales bacterium]